MAYGLAKHGVLEFKRIGRIRRSEVRRIVEETPKIMETTWARLQAPRIVEN